MSGLGSLFAKGSIAEQLVVWQVLAQLTQPVMNPVIQTLANDLWTVDPNVPVSPSTMAQLVARGLASADDGVNESSKSGTGKPQFDRMVKAAQGAPSLAEAVELWRRGKIETGTPGEAGTTFCGALTDAGVRPEWQSVLMDLRHNEPSPEEILNALLQGQIDREPAKALYQKLGGDLEYFDLLFNSQGTAPTPDMAAALANRGIIPWEGHGTGVVSYEQAFLEGPWRDKWESAMRRLAEYLPPPRTVTAMVRDGSITDQLALSLFMKEGLSRELAAAYLASAHHGHATADKSLARGDILALYKSHKIDHAKARELLIALHYSPANADLVLSLADVAKADTHLTAAITKTRTLYVSHKITREAAASTLATLQLPDAQRAELLALWGLERDLNVRQLTEAQIVQAYGHAIMTEAEARTELGHLGYTPYDAWVLLSIHDKKPLPNKPAQGPGPGTVA